MSICYRINATPYDAVVTFVSDVEMGGPGPRVDEIRVTRADRAPNEASQCSTPRLSPGGVAAGPLRLGMSRAEVQRVLGSPTSHDADSISYSWESERALARSHSHYAFWNKRRQECFGGRAPFVYILAGVVVRFDAQEAYEYVLSRSDTGIC
jgi:hypothetical protein